MDNEENNNVENEEVKKESSFDTDELKEETKETFNKVKDQIKDTDFKEETKKATNFVKEMCFNPIEAVEEVASGAEVNLGRTIVLLVALMAANFVETLFSYFKWGSFSNLGSKFWGLVLSVTSPLLAIIVPAVLIFLFNTKARKSLLTVISTLVTAKVPVIFVTLLGVVSTLISPLRTILSIFTSVLSAVAIVLMYFGMKKLFEEDNSVFIKKYVLVLLIAQVIFVILSSINFYSF